MIKYLEKKRCVRSWKFVPEYFFRHEKSASIYHFINEKVGHSEYFSTLFRLCASQILIVTNFLKGLECSFSICQSSHMKIKDEGMNFTTICLDRESPEGHFRALRKNLSQRSECLILFNVSKAINGNFE